MTASTQSPGEGELIARDIRALCNGHPHAKIAWPHRELHALADRVTAYAERLARMEEERDGHTDAFEGVVRAKIEAERRLEEMRTNHDGALRLYSQWRSRAEKAEAELARLSRQAPKEEA